MSWISIDLLFNLVSLPSVPLGFLIRVQPSSNPAVTCLIRTLPPTIVYIVLNVTRNFSTGLAFHVFCGPADPSQSKAAGESMATPSGPDSETKSN